MSYACPASPQGGASRRRTLDRREKTLVGFEARYAHVHDQLRLLLNVGMLNDWNRQHHGGKLAICELVSEQYPLVIFHGDVGTGKTAMAECIANKLVAEARSEDSILFKLSNRVRGSGMVGEMGTGATFASERSRTARLATELHVSPDAAP